MKNKTIFKSRRGDFFLTEDIQIEVVPEEFKITEKRLKDVKEEIQFAKEGRLEQHKYWDNEPISFTKEYEKLYQRLFDIPSWLYYTEARHNIVVNETTCVSLIQYFNGTLFVYSRSTDMRNGYFGDKVVIHLLREEIRKVGYEVKETLWLKLIPHEYVEKGIARLLNIEEYM